MENPGLTLGASAGFKLPNGAIRAPDASWLSKSRWDGLPVEERFPYPNLCLEFVVEVMSPSDRLTKSHEKMREYLITLPCTIGHSAVIRGFRGNKNVIKVASTDLPRDK